MNALHLLQTTTTTTTLPAGAIGGDGGHILCEKGEEKERKGIRRMQSVDATVCIIMLEQNMRPQAQHSSSIPIRPIFMPARAKARRALWAPGPGCLDLVPPVALILM